MNKKKETIEKESYLNKYEFFNNKHTIHSILILILLIVLILILYIPLINDVNNIKDKLENEINITKNDNFVFLGDSLTDWYPIEELYEEDIPIVNSGRAGYNTRDILKNLDEMVYIYNPTKVIILIGTNDLNCDITEEETLSNITQIIKDIKKNRPSAKIYIQSIYPINNTDNDKINNKNVGKRTNEIIIEINKKIKNICDEQNVTYIDIYNDLTDSEGNLKLSYTEDGLHLSSLGYLKVTKLLMTYIEE